MARLAVERIRFGELTYGVFVCGATVPRDGFRWVTGRAAMTPPRPGGEERYLVVASAPPGRERLADGFAPFTRGGLPRDFAGLAPTEDAILAFANEVGFLGVGLIPIKSSEGRPTVFGESLAMWKREIAGYRVLSTLWASVCRRDTDALEPLVSWSPERDRVWLSLPHRAGLIQASKAKFAKHPELEAQMESGDSWASATWDGTGSPDLLKRWQRDPVLGPIRFYVMGEVDRRLAGRVRLRTIPYARSDGKAETRFEVESILGVLYVRFHLDLTENRYDPGTRTCEFRGCVAPITGKAHYCAEHRPEADKERKRRNYHAHPERNERRRKTGQGGPLE